MSWLGGCISCCRRHIAACVSVAFEKAPMVYAYSYDYTLLLDVLVRTDNTCDPTALFDMALGRHRTTK